MQFVVPIPLWLYGIFLMVAFSLGVYVFLIVAAVGFIYLLFRAPKETLGFILLAFVFKYWIIAVPILIVAVIANYFIGSKSSAKNNLPELTYTDAEQSTEAQRADHE